MEPILRGFNFYSLFYTTVLTLCSGFVLISSAYGSNNNLGLFPPGGQIIYEWKSSVILNEIEGNTKYIGFLVNGKLKVSSVWGSANKQLLRFELISPKLHVKSKKSSSEFASRPSKLNSLENKPFLVVINEGVVEKIYLAKDEHISLKNIKKGIASIFQFQPWTSNTKEVDASGYCNTSYTSKSSTKKVKAACVIDDINNRKHENVILGTNVESDRTIEYRLDQSNSYLETIELEENHKVISGVKRELGSIIVASQKLSYDESRKCDIVEEQNFERALGVMFDEINSNLVEDSLITKVDSLIGNEKKSFSEEVGLLRGDLKAEHLGSLKSAKAFLRLVDSARLSNQEEIIKVLGSKKNANILFQLYDILGYVQTKSSHDAVMKFLHLDNEEQRDPIERYLWALSFSTHPNPYILEDLLHKYRKYSVIPDYTRDTLILSLASMARRLMHSQQQSHHTIKIIRNVEETIINGFDYAKDKVRYVFINALKNLHSPSSLPKLISIVKNGTLKEEVLAWTALKSFEKSYWDSEILKQAEKTLYQIDRKHDTSSRTIAADILLGAEPTDVTLNDLLNFVASNETKYEIKQYVFQSIRMMSDRSAVFGQRVSDLIKRNSKLNNYVSLSPRGLSTALVRDIFYGTTTNGSLVSIQEIKDGIVKRGAVDVVLEKNGVSQELFTLGIFAGGLSSFTSSNSDDNEEEEENEATTAGMELTVLGTQIRPFVFFEGQGELMGHVWSGTGSEMTPAFQALVLTQDHEEYLRLGNGFIVDISMKGATSFDLSGKIEISIWSRNAQSLIEKSVGYVSKGVIKVDTPFVKSQVQLEASLEPQLRLEIDADFSSNVKLCMRLSQPESTFEYTVNKLEEVPEGQHILKLVVDRKKVIPGRTYALNKKNSEMCSAISS